MGMTPSVSSAPSSAHVFCHLLDTWEMQCVAVPKAIYILRLLLHENGLCNEMHPKSTPLSKRMCGVGAAGSTSFPIYFGQQGSPWCYTRF